MELLPTHSLLEILTSFSKKSYSTRLIIIVTFTKEIYLKIIVKFSFECNFNSLFFPRKCVPKTFFTFLYFIGMYLRIRSTLTIKFSSKKRGHKFTPLKIST